MSLIHIATDWCEICKYIQFTQTIESVMGQNCSDKETFCLLEGYFSGGNVQVGCLCGVVAWPANSGSCGAL